MYVQLLGMKKYRELETWWIQEAKQKWIFVHIAAGIAMTTVQNQEAAMGNHHAGADQKEQ
jgi:hydrogenase maturation factor